MGMSKSMAPRIYLTLECSMCKQYMDDEKAEHDVMMAQFFGCKKYAVCLNCKQEVSEADQTLSYKQRWTRRWNQAKKEAEKISAEIEKIS